MHQIVPSTNIRGSDRQTRHLYVPSEPAIAEFEKNTEIGWLYAVWAGQRVHLGELPTSATLSDEICSNRELPYLCIAQNVLGKITHRQFSNGRWENVSQVHFATDCLEQEIRRCAREADARYYHVTEIIAGVHRRYTRLLLPRAALKGGVEDVIVTERDSIQIPVPANIG